MKTTVRRRQSSPANPASQAARSRRVALALLLGLLLGPSGSVFAQYFGQNKVNYETFDWHYLKTEHFDIYHPKDALEIARFTAWEAEQALQSIEASWSVSLQGRIIFIVYPSHNSFQNNNVGGSSPSESTGGFTEFLKNRVVIPFQGSYSVFRHVIHHELTHAVMLRTLYGEGVQSILSGISRLPLPLWFIEGMAEYESNFGWSNESDLYLRDAVINDYIMPLNRLRGYFIYKGGQSLLYYLHQRYGPEKVGDLLQRIRSRRNFNAAVKDALGIELEELSKRWHKHIKRSIWPSAADYEAPEDFALRLTDEDEERWNFINTSPALSPDGDRLVMLSDREQWISIYLMNTVTGEIEEKLVGTGGGIYLFEQLLWLRPWIDWAPDGSRIAFVAETGPEDVLFILDVDSGEITGEYRFGFDGLFSPSWSPDGSEIVFSGYRDGQSDLYSFSVEAGSSSLLRLTDDMYSDYDPDWGSDGRILFVSDRGEDLNPQAGFTRMWEHDFEQIDVYMLESDRSVLRRITADAYEDRTPTWTSRTGVISYVSDRSGAYNLWMEDLENDSTWASSDVLTGVFTPSWSDVGTVAFTSFFNGKYGIYLYKNPFDESRVLEPKLTHYQQQQREAGEAEFAHAWRPREGEAESYESGPVVPGSEDERSLRAALAAEQDAAADSSAEAEAGELEPAVADSMATEATADSMATEASADSLATEATADSSAVAQSRQGSSDEEEEDLGELSGDEEIIFVPGQGSEPVSYVSPYSNHIFYPRGMDPDEQQRQSPEMSEAEIDSLFDEQGRFIQREYSVKFSPDVVYAAAGFGTYFGLQGYGQVMFSDVLGEHVIFLGTDLYYSFENSNFSLFYYNLRNRYDWGGGAYHTVYYFSSGFDDLKRDRNYGVQGTVAYPFSRSKRVDLSLGFRNIDRDRYIDYSESDQLIDDFVQFQRYHTFVPSLAFVHDRTMWGYTGPMKGTRYRVGFSYSPKLSSGDYLHADSAGTQWGLDFKTLSADFRHYWNIGYDYSFAHRIAGGMSFGDKPMTFFLGGVSNWINRSFKDGQIQDDVEDVYYSGFATPVRGAVYYEESGTRYLLTNHEFRFPLIRQLLFGWPLPVFFNNIRGVAFLDAGAAWSGDDFRLTRTNEGGEEVFDDLVLGYGWGWRVNLGYFMLRWDIAWRNELNRVTQPRYYVSLGTDF